MSVNSIQTSAHGNTVAANAARAATAEGGQSIEAQMQMVLFMGYDTNVKIMKQKVQEYRAQLKLQQTYNDALANIEKLQSGFKDSNANTVRTADSGTLKKAQSTLDANGINRSSDKVGETIDYSSMVDEAGAGLSDAEKAGLKERAALADIAQQVGYQDVGNNQDRNALFKGDMTKGYLDGLKAKIKGAMDSIGADLQLQMIDIQTIKGRMDQYMTALSSFVKSNSDSAQSMARNL